MSLFSPIQDAIEDIRSGKMIVVVDDENRENEGDLVMAAAHVTPDHVNFMAQKGRGLICAPLSGEIADFLELEPMVAVNTGPLSTNFTVSVDYKHGTSTGISMMDRAKTLQALSQAGHNQVSASDFVRPGHIFPLRAEHGGVLMRQGHTEAAVDLAILAGLPPVGVICEVIRDDGEMARMPELEIFIQHYGLKLITIKDLHTHLQLSNVSHSLPALQNMA